MSGRNPGFTTSSTIIWSSPGFMVSCISIWSFPRLHNNLLGIKLLSVDFRASPLVFMIYHYLVDSRLHGVFVLLSGWFPGFTVSCWGFNYFPVDFWASYLEFKINHYLVDSRLRGMMDKSRYYSVDLRASRLVFMIYHYLVESRLHSTLALLSGHNPGFTETCWAVIRL